MPVTIEQLVAFGVAAFVLIAIPGPSVVFVVGRALAHGRGVALASVLGNTLGLTVVLGLVAAGLGAVVTTSTVVFTALKLIGAGYLVWLGVRAIRHRDDFHPEDANGEGLPPVRGRVAVRQGFVVGVSNPKAFMIFAALLPQFVVTSRGQVTVQMLVLGSVALVIGLLSDALWAIAAARFRTWFAASPRRSSAMGIVGGTSMIALGVGLAVTDT